jgi:hypothetical protein
MRLLFAAVVVGCSSSAESPLVTGSDATTDAITDFGDPVEVSPPVGESGVPTHDAAACPGVDLSARLAAAAAACNSPLPTRSFEQMIDPGGNADFRSFMIGRWLYCAGEKSPGIPGPVGHVGVELTADGRLYFLELECSGEIVRGSGPPAPDGGAKESWENWYAFHKDNGQFEVYYGGSPVAPEGSDATTWRGMNILHGFFGRAPDRIWIDVMGVFASMYVRAPAKI